MGKASRRKLHPAAEPVRSADLPKPRRRATSSFPAQWLPYALVLAIGAALYANSFSIPFLFDDYFAIVNNDQIRQLDSPGAYLTRPRGATDLTLALSYQWGELDVWGYHFVNVAIHIVNGWLVYALTLALLRLPFFAGRYRARERDLAMLTALVFVAHPLQTMAASYVVQRGESLSAMFYLGSVLLFTRALAIDDRRRRLTLYLAVLAMAFLGVLSKETAATLPVILVLLHVCFGARSRGTFATRLAALLLFVAPILYALYLARYQLLPDTGLGGEAPRAWFFIPSAGFNVEGVTPWTYLLTQFGVVLWYLRLYFLPTEQCFDYGWPVVDSVWRFDVLGPLIVLLAIVAAGVLAYRRYRLATFCIGWFFLCLAPTSSIIPLRDAAFEHRMYLPIFGLTMLVVVGGYDVAQRLASRAKISEKHVLAGLGTLGALWIAMLGGLTVARNHVYQDPMRLAHDSLTRAPHNWRAYYEYADELARRGRVEEAEDAFRESIRLAPEKGTARVRLGGMLIEQRRLEEAEAVLTPATEVLEESVAAAAHRHIGYLYLMKHDTNEAEYHFRQAAELMPRWASVQLELGKIYHEQGLWYGAAGRLNDAIELNPRLASRFGRLAADANYRSGISFFEQKKMRAAIQMFRHAIRHQPDFADAHHYLAAAYAAREQWDEAREALAELERRVPDDPLLKENLQRIEDLRQPLKPSW